jgi:hypothetical protein
VRTHPFFASGQHPSGPQRVPVKVIAVTEVTGYYDDNLQKRSRQHRTFRPKPETLTEKESYGLYERLLEERAEEEQRLGEPLPRIRSLASKILVRRLEDASRRSPGYAADLSMLHRLIVRGPRNAGEGMRLGSLKAKYPKEYCELRAERQGQQELS